jgi:hypothetical protein
LKPFRQENGCREKKNGCFRRKKTWTKFFWIHFVTKKDAAKKIGCFRRKKTWTKFNRPRFVTKKHCFFLVYMTVKRLWISDKTVIPQQILLSIRSIGFVWFSLIFRHASHLIGKNQNSDILATQSSYPVNTAYYSRMLSRIVRILFLT